MATVMTSTSSNGSKENGNSAEAGSELRKRLRRRRRARTYEELKRRALEEADGRSALLEEPIDTGLWPTAGLSDTQVSMLAEVIDGKPQKR